MRNAKSGQWWDAHPEFRLANNSVSYTEKPDMGSFMEEWKSLYESKSGERGIFNREGVQKKIKRIGKRDPRPAFGTNPCGEISLRPYGLCNLSEIVVRSTDTEEDLFRKARIASILGTIQSTLTDFRYVRNVWKRNADEERLLGGSMTGIYDNPLTYGIGCEELLIRLNDVVNSTNREMADRLGIPHSVSTTCVKPAGTTSSLCATASGIHPRHSEFYIRSVRQDNKDPLTEFLKDAGIPHEPDIMKPDSTTVFYFPMKSPEGAMVRDKITALDHLKLWMKYNKYWAEHQVSITVNLKEGDWMDAGAWVYRNFDEITGVSFLPYDGGSYKQAPFQACDESTYLEALSKMPSEIDWSKLSEYEKDDNTTASQELACVGGFCEI